MPITLNGTDGIVSPAGTFSGALQANGIATNIYPLVPGAVQASTSGSSIDYTGIPSWVRRIIVTGANVSFAAAGASRIRIGTSAGLVTTGYVGGTINVSGSNTTAIQTISDGFLGAVTTAAASTASFVATLIYQGNDLWICSVQSFRLADGFGQFATGNLTLSGVLDRISLVATTSTFDAGSINILYE